MFGGEIYIQAKIYEIEKNRKTRPLRHFRGNPEADAPRTGVGLVHEVFRRITSA
jgi:hypothetical protein